MRNKLLIGIILCVVVIGCTLYWKFSFNYEEKDISNYHSVETKENNLVDDVIGRWNADNAVNSETGEKITNLREIFGSSYSLYGSYLELKDDGTFIDAISPITDGSKDNVGTYEVKRNYNQPGDCYVFLTYSDGNVFKLHEVIIDDSNTKYLLLDNYVDGYQFMFKK